MWDKKARPEVHKGFERIKMDKIQILAYAKINLGLDVLRRREDGYHDLRMIMQTIGVCDTLTIEKTERDGGIELSSNIPSLPCDGSNLICKAAKLMMEEYSLPGGLRIHLEKEIPMAAGLAGGSTDAAATFNGINRLFELGIPKEELCRLGVKVGADVPYCIVGGTCLAEGIGERLTNLPALSGATLVLIKPDFDVSTKYVYENLHANELKVHPDIDGQLSAIGEGNLEKTVALMGNVLENVSVQKYPEIRQIKDDLVSLRSFGAMMSGSGPSVFGFFKDQNDAVSASRVLKEKYPAAAVFVTGFISDIDRGV